MAWQPVVGRQCPATWHVEITGRETLSSDCVVACADHAGEATCQIADVLLTCESPTAEEARDLLVRYPSCTAVVSSRGRVMVG